MLDVLAVRHAGLLDRITLAVVREFNAMETIG